MQFLFHRESALFLSTPVENLFLLEYMPQAPEGYVKAYLYGLALCYCRALPGEDIAAALQMSGQELAEAFLYWQAKGFLSVISSEPLIVEYKNIKHAHVEGASDSAAVTRRYQNLLADMQAVLGARMLTGPELSKVYDWLEVFGFAEDAVLLLVRHCVKQRGERVSVKYMDAVARAWADEGVLTAEAAEEYLSQYDELNGGAQRLLKRWRVGRRPTEDELALYRLWTNDWGFDEAAIFAACAEMTGTSKPSFKYLNAILDSWRTGGTLTAQDADARMRARAAVTELARLAFSRAGLKRAPTGDQIDQIERWHTAFHMDAELILFAADCAVNASSPFLKMRKLISQWHEEGIATLEAARESVSQPKRGADGSVPRALDYPQRKYSAEELENMGINLLDGE
ncbi:MAG: DnaD domain protein [Eubacteriales bacterium]|nr:DnaD domain protein [Eubacteriales bacterium]